ncbi:MAG: hypothetical protein SWE60_00785 [Thermodesulfobacteriota bacterium]|nr:hypothetical protein [Thermodesulfobacteriota bacterium]
MTKDCAMENPGTQPTEEATHHVMRRRHPGTLMSFRENSVYGKQIESNICLFLCKIPAKVFIVAKPHSPLSPDKETETHNPVKKRAKPYYITYKNETQAGKISG